MKKYKDIIITLIISIVLSLIGSLMLTFYESNSIFEKITANTIVLLWFFSAPIAVLYWLRDPEEKLKNMREKHGIDLEKIFIWFALIVSPYYMIKYFVCLYKKIKSDKKKDIGWYLF